MNAIVVQAFLVGGLAMLAVITWATVALTCCGGLR